MIEHLKNDDLAEKTGGRFKLCTLIQRRLGELMDGARPLVEREVINGKPMSDLQIVIEEIAQEKITLEFVKEGGADEPEEALL